MTHDDIAYGIALLFLAVVVLHLQSALNKERRQHARERDLLLNQLLHATGNTWTPPPAEPPRAPEPEQELMPARFQAAPEQHIP